MPGTTLTYNGVILRDCETVAFDQELQYDQSGTDAQYSRITIHVRGNVHRDLIATCRTDIVEAAPGRAAYPMFLALVRQQLMQPRKTLSFITDQDTLLYVEAPSPFQSSQPYTDVDNGPKPVSVNVTEVVGGSFYRVEFVVRVALIYCSATENTAGTLISGPVVSNRWSVSEERDANFFVTRTVEGILRVMRVEHWPHWFRNMVVPRLPLGFRRVSMWFGDTPDGLTLRYRIVDKQEHAAPPAPAVNWTAVYTEIFATMGEEQHGSMHVALDGDPDCNKQDLYLAAMAVVLERLRGIHDGTDIPSQLTVIEHLHAPHVEVIATVKHTDVDKEAFSGRLDLIGKEFDTDALKDYKKDEWPIPPNYSPSQPSRLWYHYLQDPCGPAPILSDDPEYEVPEPDEDPGQDPDDQWAWEFVGKTTTIEYQQLPSNLQDLPPSQLDPLQEQIADRYSYYNLEGDFDIKQGIIHLPTGTVRVKTLKPDPESSTGSGEGVERMLPNFSPPPIQPPGGGPAEPVYNDLYSVVVPVFQPLCQRNLFIHGERYRSWPQFPLPVPRYVDDNGIVYTLLRYKMHPRTTRILTDGRTRIYRAMMEYTYAMSRAPNLADDFYVGHDPRSVTNVEAELFSLANVFDPQSNQRLS